MQLLKCYLFSSKIVNLRDYGFVQSDTDWQLIQIPLSAFAANTRTQTQYDEFEITFSDTPIIELDWIVIQGSVINPSNATKLEGYNETGSQTGDDLDITIGDLNLTRLELDVANETIKLYKGTGLFLHETFPSGNGDCLYLGKTSGNITATTSEANTGIGSKAMQSLVAGSYNTALGTSSLLSLANGDRNVSLGVSSAVVFTTGDDNSSVGTNALFKLTTGDRNTTIGSASQKNLELGDDNTSVGYSALKGSDTGAGVFDFSKNVGIGVNTGADLRDGANNNILIGYGAGETVTTGANNIIIGYEIDAQANTDSNKLIIGNLIFGTAIDGTGTGLSSGNIGVGVVAPATKLHVNGAVTQNELSADPANPAEGSYVQWMSDGVGSGDDGDIMVKITAGGVTKTTTLLDFSTL